MEGLHELCNMPDEELHDAIFARRLGDLNVSKLLKLYLDFLQAIRDQDDFEQPRPASLKSMALEGIVWWLNTSDDLSASARAIMSNLDAILVRDLLMTPSMRYAVLRACLDAARDSSEDDQSIVNIDEVVVTNERYLRSRKEQVDDDSHLISLEEFCKIHAIIGDDRGVGLLNRPTSPLGGVNLLHFAHNDSLLIRTSSAEVTRVLKKDVEFELGGLDWSNVLRAGNPVMRAVMIRTITPVRHSVMKYKPIDLVLYGLNSEQANTKVSQIHDVWASRLAAGIERIVVKDGTSIIFIASTSIRPVRVRTKLFKSITEALLDLGPGAIGLDGSRMFSSLLFVNPFPLWLRVVFGCSFHHHFVTI